VKSFSSLPMRRGRILSTVAMSLALTFVIAGAGVATAQGGASLAAVRQATLKYRDVNAAIADGYVEFYKCTEQPGVGTMGQHYVKLPLVGDPSINATTPEVLVYAPKRNGGLRLVAVEYVVLEQDWVNAFGSAKPTVLGQDMLFRPAGNRYDLPNFYERHAWIWQGNPLGTFNDWNPDISCLGNGDNGG
jgi:hypothetical protein